MYAVYCTESASSKLNEIICSNHDSDYDENLPVMSPTSQRPLVYVDIVKWSKMDVSSISFKQEVFSP